MKLTLAQINPKIGAVNYNLDLIQRFITREVVLDHQVMIFPELVLTGYPPRDLLNRPALLDQVQSAVSVVCQLSSQYPNLGILLGAPTRHSKGRGLRNSAILIHNGSIVFTQHKTLLPTYDVFDEDRYFDPADTIDVFPFFNEQLGISICEDAWNPDIMQGRYSVNPIEILVQKGATLLINISASPFNTVKHRERLQLFSRQIARFRRPFVYVNQVGANDELIFDGKSFCLNASAELVMVLDGFIESAGSIDCINGNLNASGPILCNQMNSESDRVADIYQALVLGVKDYFRKCGFKKALIGLSGGIDSALTAVIAVDALGKSNVFGVTMPSQYSSKGSVSDSLDLAKNLDIACQIIPILPIVDSFESALQPLFANTESGLAEENIQARVRGNILMAISNKFGYLLLSTGNKSELAVGYCTLYGDMSGGLDVLSDIPKTVVYELADYVNRTKEIIPRDTIIKPPSAELRPDQCDQDTLPPYDILDQILAYYIEDSLSCADIVQKGFDPETVDWVIRAVNRNEYKRRQAAPGLKISTKAFGMGRRYPIAAEIPC